MEGRFVMMDIAIGIEEARGAAGGENGPESLSNCCPVPWYKVVHRTAIALKDAGGTVVAILPFSPS